MVKYYKCVKMMLCFAFFFFLLLWTYYSGTHGLVNLLGGLRAQICCWAPGNPPTPPTNNPLLIVYIQISTPVLE